MTRKSNSLLELNTFFSIILIVELQKVDKCNSTLFIQLNGSDFKIKNLETLNNQKHKTV